MSNQTPRHTLPHAVEALKCCQQQVRIQGTVPLASLPRLASQLQCTDGEASVTLAFHTDEQARRRVDGSLAAVLPLVCQRCLDVVEVPVTATLSLALVWNDEQAARLPRSLDPVVMTDQELDLHAVVEEELLLAMPLVPQHAAGQCETPAMSPVEQAEPDVPAARDNPFQVLANLKTAMKNAD